MFLTSNLRQCSKLSLNSETKVVFNENIEFFVAVICNKDTYNFDLKIEKIKGNFSNLRIASTTSPLNLPFNDTTKTYKTDAFQLQNSYSFVIECEVEYKIVSSSIWSTTLSFSSDRLKFLNIFECYQDQITIADYENYKLDYFVKKVDEDFVEITVKNPHKIQINGQKEDYNIITIVMQNLDLNLTLVFDPKVMELLNENNHDDAIFDTEKVEQHSSAENQNENFPTLENQSELTIDEEFIAEIADDVVSNVSSDKVVSTENDETPDSEPHSQKNSNDTESNENTVTFEYDIPIDISNVLIEIPSQKNSLDTVSNVFKNLRLFPSIFSSIH